MLQKILNAIKAADSSKELWISTDKFNKLLEESTKVTLSERGNGHILNIQLEGNNIGVCLKDSFPLKNGECCYVKVLKINQKKFEEYEVAAEVIL